MSLQSVRIDQYPIHSWEADQNGKATLPALCNYMQESAWKHAEKLQAGYSHLIEKNLAWVLARNQIIMERYPQWGDTMTIRTWPTGIERLFFFRDFELTDNHGERLGLATTTWFVIDIDSRRPQRPDKFFNLDISTEPSVFPDHAEKVEPLSEIEGSANTHAGYFDMDVNGHVTNVRYIEWILKSYENSFLKNHRIQNFAINHIGEALAGDLLNINREPAGPGSWRHSIIQAETGKELCRAQIYWGE